MLIQNKHLNKKLTHLLTKVYETTLHILNQPIDELDVALYFYPDKKMRALNAQYRKIDKTTDVLSFPATNVLAGQIVSLADYMADIDPQTDRLLLGEIFISPTIAKRQAKEYGHSYLREVCFLFCHGLLHILGYDHIEDKQREEMEDKQRVIMNMCEIQRS